MEILMTSVALDLERDRREFDKQNQQQEMPKQNIGDSVKGAEKMPENYDFDEEMRREKVREYRQQMQDLSWVHNEAIKEQRRERIAQVERDKALMKKIKSRGFTAEQYIDALDRPESQTFFQKLYDSGTERLLDEILGPQKPVETPEQARKREVKALQDQIDEPLGRGIVVGRDSYIEHIVKKALPDGDPLTSIYGWQGGDPIPKKRRR